jgi:cobalt-zinc-cadmium efflux system protein
MHGSHDHAHDHAPENFGWRFAIATALNVALVLGQIWYGFAANSLALLADAGHNFGDVLGLVMAWAAFALADWKPSKRFTYRMDAASILSALANGLLLVVAIGAIGYEAIQRLIHPQPVATADVIIVGSLAVVANGLSAWLLSGGSRADINMRGAFLHMLADAGVSVAVVLAAFGIMLTGWQWLDPAASLAISLVILWGTWNLLRDATRLMLNAAPRDIDPHAIGDYLVGLPEVADVHDLHIWAMSTRETALTCHLVTPDGPPGDEFLRRVAHDLHDRFDVDHPTLQIELADGGQCPLRCELPV